MLCVYDLGKYVKLDLDIFNPKKLLHTLRLGQSVIPFLHIRILRAL